METIDEKIENKKQKALALGIFEKIKTAAMILGKKKRGIYTGGGGGLAGGGFTESYEIYKVRRGKITISFTSSRYTDNSGSDYVYITFNPLGGFDVLRCFDKTVFYQENNALRPEKNVGKFRDEGKWLSQLDYFVREAIEKKNKQNTSKRTNEELYRRKEIKRDFGTL